MLGDPRYAAHRVIPVPGAQLTYSKRLPARLSERIGLSFGATSTLLNRLEAVRHMTRHRGHADRRIVTLHSTSTVHAIADRFFDPLDERIQEALAGYSSHDDAGDGPEGDVGLSVRP